MNRINLNIINLVHLVHLVMIKFSLLDVDVVAFVDPRIIYRHLNPLPMSVYRSGDRCHLVSLQRHARHGDSGVGVALCAVRCQRDVSLIPILGSQHKVAEYSPCGASQVRHIHHTLIIHSLCNVHRCP